LIVLLANLHISSQADKYIIGLFVGKIKIVENTNMKNFYSEENAKALPME